MLNKFPILPESASTYAAKVDLLFWALTVFVLLFAFGVSALLVYFGIKYRRIPGEERKSVHFENFGIELVWIAVPTIIAIIIFAWGAWLYLDLRRMPENTLDISVIGKQWMWKLQHPNGRREVNELHVPVGRPVKLTMTSQDVIHSFYVPAFRLKQDVLPARYTNLWFEATKTGEFQLFCAEYCGTQHAKMKGKVVVMEPADYEEWLQGGPPVTPAMAGEMLFEQMGCVTCHAAGDSSRGPRLNGVFGKDVTLRGGAVVLADEEYIRESIFSPTAKVAEGYVPLMPSFKSQLDDDAVANLVAYIKTLSDTEE